MQTHSLIAHPAFPPRSVETVTAKIVSADDGWLQLRWRIEGAGEILIPPLTGKHRADGLWQTTCFELFVNSQAAAGYAEFNLSPSECWAAYDFSAYRADMADRLMPRDPVCTWRAGRKLAIFDAAVPLRGLPPLPWRCGLAAVLEEQGGVKSYWAIAHPPGKPDFHDAACFAAMVAAPQGA